MRTPGSGPQLNDVIKVDRLEVVYGDGTRAVDAIDFSVHDG